MNKHYVLIDFENVQVQSLALLKGDLFRVYVFLGPNNTKLPVDLVIAMQKMGSRATYIILEKPGNNALDFHIAYYLGVLSKEDPDGYFHIISKDSGFDPLIQYLRKIRILVSRSELIEDIPALNEASPTVPHADSTVPPPVPIHPAPHKEPDHVVALSHLETDAWTRSVQDHLIKQKAARPRTLKSLLNTIHAKCGKGVSEDQVKIVYQKLVHRGYVKLQGTRVVYNLPAS